MESLTQLPLDVSHFTGRENDMAQLSALLDTRGQFPVSTVVISAISGTAGVGKTALAVHWAHRVAERFLDGQLYINMRGYDSGPRLSPDTALTEFLRALGVPAGEIPQSQTGKEALFRSRTANRSLLIVIDNVNSAEQVRPLLPSSPNCLTIVTSRSRLSGLIAQEGAHRISLDLLRPDESLDLLESLIGQDRVRQEQDQANEIVRLCGYLPLALRIAGQRVSERQTITLEELTRELSDERGRLGFFATEDEDERSALSAVFYWSYKALPIDLARTFRLLALHPGVEFSPEAASALIGETVTFATLNLQKLRGSHLVEEHTKTYYRFHDLMRLYARSCVEEYEPQIERDHAIGRLLYFYLHSADLADRRIAPQRRQAALPAHGEFHEPMHFRSREEAVSWCEAERFSIVAVTRLAESVGQFSSGWRLPIVLWGYFHLRKRWKEWLETHSIALRCVRAEGDRFSEGRILNSTGNCFHEQRSFEEALTYYTQALAIRRETDDLWGEAFTLNNMGECYQQTRQYRKAIDCYKQVVQIDQDLDYFLGEALAVNNIGEVYLELRELDAAITQFERALQIERQANYRWGEGITLNNIGAVQIAQSDTVAAITTLQTAIEAHIEAGSKWGEAVALNRIAEAYRQLGRFDDAISDHRLALIAHREVGDLWQVAHVLSCLGETYRARGDDGLARQYLVEAAEVFRSVDRFEEEKLRLRLEPI